MSDETTTVTEDVTPKKTRTRKVQTQDTVVPEGSVLLKSGNVYTPA